MWLPGRKMAGGEVMDSVRLDDGCSCDAEEERGRRVGDERLGRDHDLKRTHVPGGCELHEAEEAMANGVGLLWTCAASM